MVIIRFNERSLLYGYSLLWLPQQLTFPYLWTPNLFTTKHRNVISEVPNLMAILRGDKWPWLRSKYRTHLEYLFITWKYSVSSFYLSYQFFMLIVHLALQKELLASFQVVRESELTYKALYYFPIAYQGGLVALSLLTWRQCYQKEWLLYDKYAIFSLSGRAQLKIVLLMSAICLPDAIMNFFEANLYLGLTKSGEHRLVKWSNGLELPSNSLLNYTYIPILFLLYLVGNALRYRSLLNIIYSASCVASHLRIINSQLVVSRLELEASAGKTKPEDATKELSPTRGLISRGSAPARPKSGNDPTKRSADFDTDFAPLSRRRFSPGDLAKANELDQLNSSADFALDSGTLNWMINKTAVAEERVDDGLHSSSQASSTATNFRQVGAKVNSASSDISSLPAMYLEQHQHKQANKDEEYSAPVRTIRNLRQFELHITQIHFFVDDMDRISALPTFAMCLLSLVKFMYSIFALLVLKRSYGLLMVGIMFSIARLLVPFSLFIVTDLMEREARRMVAELEFVYLQDSTQCLIYKQYGSTMASLARVIKLSSTLKFDCDHLLHIHLDTMKQFMLYTLTLMFFSVQYAYSTDKQEFVAPIVEANR